jgi:hypothetical protein
LRKELAGLMASPLTGDTFSNVNSTLGLAFFTTKIAS